MIQPIDSVHLTFRDQGTQQSPAESLSAVCLTASGDLWCASDESAHLERLSRRDDGSFGDHRRFRLADLLPISAADHELDIEGICHQPPYLWVIGSHARKFNKRDGETDFRHRRIESAGPRCLIARIPLVNGDPVSVSPDGSAALVELTESGNLLTDSLAQDGFLRPYGRLPCKSGGWDIEGIAVQGDRLLLGMRGPVFHDCAVLLEIEPRIVKNRPDRLTLKPIGKRGRRHRRHLVDTGGAGIRDLAWHGEDLLLLTGPVGNLGGPFRVAVIPDADLGSGRAHRMFDIASTGDRDYPEGIADVAGPTGRTRLLTVVDRPSPERRPDAQTLKADVYEL